MPRIHILGASGSGTTTLGAALAASLSLPHQDADALFWLPTEPPFTHIRPLAPRQALLLERLKPDEDWVFSGSAISWAKPLEPSYDLIVYLQLNAAIRMERLKKRETARYGERIEPGGNMAASSAEFLSWAAAYDTAGPEQRSRVAHGQWLITRTAPVLRLDSSDTVVNLMVAVQAEIAALRSRKPRIIG